MKKKICLSMVKAFGLIAALLLSGCDKLVLMNPKGPIGHSEKSLILTATWLMLIVVIPVIIMTIAFAWKYRASNKNATYAPKWSHSNAIEAVVWLVPCIIIAILATITWKTTHELDPYKPLASNKEPVRVQVVSMDWKWLFIYPDLHIATVNKLAFPVDTPVAFDVTSSTVMNAFFIPQLGSQIYSMAGMNTKLHLMADEPGNYLGISANYSGGGFSGMHFDAEAMTDGDFNAWVEKVKASSQVLDQATFEALEEPSEDHAVTLYSNVKPNLYTQILTSFGHSHSIGGEGHTAGHVEASEEKETAASEE
ncbi:ubiquinol oxidase subunit II [Pokkaliibacter sp. CJK22405]|uniref:ubiquinol oxidase subunit II n=1 Tax=Pokkaliibacter sp. CJK22405 TaxID=3384615 RepID=UPI003984896B